jgi:hypothetical protein
VRYDHWMAIDTKALALVGARARLAELRSEIDELIAAFPALKGESSTVTPRKGRAISEATKQKMRDAWARRRAALPEARQEPSPAKRQRRKMSAAGRAAIAAAQKKRWAATKSAKKPR